MNHFKRVSTDHPASVGETYFEHAFHASKFGGAMLRGALACFIHALMPALHVSTGSRIIAGLHNQMVVNRRRASSTRPTAADLSPSGFWADDI
jgi:Family of unknown function (DUF6356)